MNKKMIYVLLGILVVLLLVFYIQKSLDRATGMPETLNELNLEFDADKVARIDVFKRDYPDSGLHFEKRDEVWVVVNEYGSPAKQEDIEKLIDDLEKVGGSVRAESANLYDEFEISDEKALQIEFYGRDDAKLLHLYVGKGGGTGRQSFVRVAGSPVTYLADDNFISRFAAWNAPPEKKLPTDRWLELKLCDIERNDLISFEIVRSKVTFKFANVEEPSEDSLAPPVKAWEQLSPEKGLRLEESKIRNLSSSVTGIRAKGVVDPANKDKFGLNAPGNIIRASDDSGKEIEIGFGDAVNDEEERYAVVNGRDTVYKIDKSTFERFFIRPFETPE